MSRSTTRIEQFLAARQDGVGHFLATRKAGVGHFLATRKAGVGRIGSRDRREEGSTMGLRRGTRRWQWRAHAAGGASMRSGRPLLHVGKGAGWWRRRWPSLTWRRLRLLHAGTRQGCKEAGVGLGGVVAVSVDGRGPDGVAEGEAGEGGCL